MDAIDRITEAIVARRPIRIEFGDTVAVGYPLILSCTDNNVALMVEGATGFDRFQLDDIKSVVVLGEVWGDVW